MARKSNIARDLKRQKMIQQYAAKRAELTPALPAGKTAVAKPADRTPICVPLA